MFNGAYDPNDIEPVTTMVFRRRSNDRGTVAEALFFGAFASVFGGLLWAFQSSLVGVIIFGLCTFVALCKLVQLFKRLLLQFESVLKVSSASLSVSNGRGTDGTYSLASEQIARIYIDQVDRTVRLIGKDSSGYLLTEHLDWYDGSAIRFREFVVSQWPWVVVWLYHNDWTCVSRTVSPKTDVE